MKQLRHLILFASLAVIFLSCQKELSNESGNPANSASQWEFTEASSNFKGRIDTAYLEPSGGFQSVIFEGTSEDGKGQIFMQVFGASLTATSYKNPNVSFEYVENGSAIYSNVPTNIDAFTVVITTINATSVTGTFSGEVENAAGEPKSITNGKFSLVLKATDTPPLLGICKLSNIGYIDLPTGVGYASLTSTFNGTNKVSRVQFIDSSSLQSLSDFSLNHSATRVTLDAEQYFDLDANGRIKTFTGYFDAVKDSTAQKVIINYKFDANGYMTKAEYSLPSAPTVVLYEVNFTWTNGNLTRTVSVPVGSMQKIQYDYEYDASKTAKESICLFPNFEVFYSQSAVNYGKNSTNVPTKSTLTIYNSAGAVEQTDVATFTNYVLDSKNYVKSFELKGEGSFLYSDTRYALSYKCY
ncbi:MAG: hypothetical protein EOO04_33275 [Chitinophagaceae bacterium]|nr:MAG: hypothetical protein EOO04_33275 [Chitinophagaceae bacterium]